MTESTGAPGGATYRGLFGAYRYALSASDSLLCRSYVVVSAVLGVAVAALLVLALVVWIANPVGQIGERALLGVVAIAVLAPLFAPVLFVARHHRRDAADRRYDAALALAGYAFLASLYAGLVVSIPRTFESGGEVVRRTPPSGPLAPVVKVLYDAPPEAAVVPPLVAAILILAVHRLAR